MRRELLQSWLVLWGLLASIAFVGGIFTFRGPFTEYLKFASLFSLITAPAVSLAVAAILEKYERDEK